MKIERKSKHVEVLVPCSANKKNRSMQLVFDIYTARPHLILIHKNSAGKKCSANEEEIFDLFVLVKEFLVERKEFDENIILSFHRGDWYQQNDGNFHAHLCVPQKTFSESVKISINDRSTQKIWSSPIQYLRKVEDNFRYGLDKFESYKKRCLNLSKHFFDDLLSEQIGLEQFSTDEFELVFLASTPRIGVLPKKAQLDLNKLYFFMNNFYQTANERISKIYRQYKQFGAHLCIFINGKSKRIFDFDGRAHRFFDRSTRSSRTAPIVAYLQIDEQLFLRWLPNIFHSAWINEFRRSTHFVIT